MSFEPLNRLASATGQSRPSSGASGAGRAEDRDQADSVSQRAAYVRPTPTPPSPRMVMDAESDSGFGFDWARKAAQAVVAHAIFMTGSDAVSAAYASTPATQAPTDFKTAISAYAEFGSDPQPAVEDSKS